MSDTWPCSSHRHCCTVLLFHSLFFFLPLTMIPLYSYSRSHLSLDAQLSPPSVLLHVNCNQRLQNLAEPTAPKQYLRVGDHCCFFLYTLSFNIGTDCIFRVIIGLQLCSSQRKPPGKVTLWHLSRKYCIWLKWCVLDVCIFLKCSFAVLALGFLMSLSLYICNSQQDHDLNPFYVFWSSFFSFLTLYLKPKILPSRLQ